MVPFRLPTPSHPCSETRVAVHVHVHVHVHVAVVVHVHLRVRVRARVRVRCDSGATDSFAWVCGSPFFQWTRRCCP